MGGGGPHTRGAGVQVPAEGWVLGRLACSVSSTGWLAGWPADQRASKSPCFLPLHPLPAASYKYAVVDEQLEVIKWESETHTIALPDGLEAGAIIDIFDQWQACWKGWGWGGGGIGQGGG